MNALPKLYLITDRKLFPTTKAFLDKIEELLQAGIKMLQIREKDLSTAALYDLSVELRKISKQYGALLLINDRVDIALACQADGVHLGGTSLPVSLVRKMLGPDKIIGVSAHNETEILKAAQTGATFVTFGPIFYTASKAGYGSPVGPEALTKACQKAPLPIYALGGIKPSNVSSLKASGVYGIAAISALLEAKNSAHTCSVFIL